jgi:peroxiredoxin Q/BCP
MVMSMRSAFKLALGAALAVVATVSGLGQNNSPDLKPGDDAPPFDLMGSDGRRHRLSDFKGRSAVVLAWFPKAFTGG